MSIILEDTINQLEELPTGNYKYDEAILNTITLRTLILIEEEFARDDRHDHLHFLISSLISKIEDFETVFPS